MDDITNDLNDIINSFNTISTEQIFEECFEDYIYALFHNIIYPIQVIKEFLNIQNKVLSETERLLFYSQLNQYFDFNYKNTNLTQKLKNIPEKESLKITQINSYNYTIQLKQPINELNNITICITLTNESFEYFLNTSSPFISINDDIKIVESFFITKSKDESIKAVYISPKISKL